MKLFTVLLLASLASTSLAILHEPEDEIPLKTQATDDSTQLAPINHPGKASISSEDPTTETFISTEPISKENVVIKSTGPKSQKREVLHPILQGDSSKHAMEDTTEFTPTVATTSEGKSTIFGYKMGKDLKKVIKEILDYLKGLLPNANDVMGP